MIARAALLWGLGLWVVATAILVPFGHDLFASDAPLPGAVSVALADVVTFVGLFFLAHRLLLGRQRITRDDGAMLGAYLALPGLLLDGALVAASRGRYPGLDANASGAMCAGLLLAYAAALLASLAAAAVLARRRVAP